MLLANGHLNAWEYPLGMLWEESELVVDRINRQAATDATLLQAAAASVISKQGGTHFRNLIKDLTGN